MSRKILKVLISLLFLAVAAVAAVLGIKSFFPELFEQVKYGVKHIIGEPARKTPAFKKDKQEQEIRVTPNYIEGNKYGVAPVNNLSVEQQKQREREIKMREQYELKYGVAPIRRPPYRNDMSKAYGVEPVRRQDIDAFIPGSNDDIYTEEYGVAPIDYEEELLKHQNKKDK